MFAFCLVLALATGAVLLALNARERVDGLVLVDRANGAAGSENRDGSRLVGPPLAGTEPSSTRRIRRTRLRGVRGGGSDGRPFGVRAASSRGISKTCGMDSLSKRR